MSNMFGDLFGKPKTSKPTDLRIAFAIWSEKQPFFQKIPKEDDVVIKIKAGDFRKLAGMSYNAGFERGRL